MLKKVLASRSHCPLALLAVGGSLLMGCANTVVLQSPFNLERIGVASAPGPKFVWRPETPIDGIYRTEYKILVSRDQAFGPGLVFSKEGLASGQYEIPLEEGWLPGGAEYFWKVEGIVRDKEGEVLEQLICQNPRSFVLEKRELVAIDFKVPTGPDVSSASVRVGDEESKADFSFEMENGERRALAIALVVAGKEVLVAGDITVVGVNENIKYGKILIDNLAPEKLVSFSTDQVGDYTYELGGLTIVKVKLGSRTKKD
jgi:hypothetical protein